MKKTPANDNVIRVLLIDDYQLLRHGLAALIDKEPGMCVVAEADHVEDALMTLNRVHAEIVVIHLKTGGLSGLEMTQRMLRAHPALRVIVMIPLSLGVQPSRMLRAGAAAYVTPCITEQEMLWTLHLVHSGQRCISPRIASHFERQPALEQRSSPFDQLSERELQIALMLVDHQKVNKISEHLCISRKTVYSYRYRIFAKLNLNSDVELTILAVKHGLSDAFSAASVTR
jgi:DNA-binding NarL/FixJ family response regulator